MPGCLEPANCAAKNGEVAACCAGACVDTKRDIANCGGCGQSCPPPPHASAACTGGACGIGACDAGHLDCDGRAGNGCEIATASDVGNCGGCGVTCAALANAVPQCVGGACVLGPCLADWGDCDHVTNNGCESALSDVSHCGACGVVCVPPPHAEAACDQRQCSMGACVGPWLDCNQSAVDGCEVDPTSDARHCGGCGRTCNLPGAVPTCAAGQCAIGKCVGATADCDKMVANGCECQYPNAAVSCRGGACSLGSCDAGFGDCDGDPKNGCEVDLNGDRANCGACGKVCGANLNCSGGVCVVAGVNAWGQFFRAVSCTGVVSPVAMGTASDGEIVSLAESVPNQVPGPTCIDLPGGGIELLMPNYVKMSPFSTSYPTGIYGSKHSRLPNLGLGPMVPCVADGPELQNLATILGYPHYKVLFRARYGADVLLSTPIKATVGYIDNNGLLAFGPCCNGVSWVMDIQFTP